ncbi:MAG: transcriptional regulator GlxA family with amidase domain [Rubritalea sp.]|jgi:transcriptional regulator GlxA family with amidase domain
MSRHLQRHISLCLCPRSPMFCIASGLEVLRHANRFASMPVYSWSFLCENDEPIQDSNDLWLHPSTNISSAASPDIALVVAGFNPTEIIAPKMTQWLKQQAARGCVIGGLSNGAFLLAKAGLLDGYSATVHWENFSSFCHQYPKTLSRYQRFVIDRNRMTCSGGSSTLDLFIEMVRNDLGHDLAQQVSRQMLLQHYSMPGETETQLVFEGNHHFSARVQLALSLLDAEVPQRMNVSGLADRVGISRRELLRLFRREIGKTPGEVLNQRRLERAQSLVLHSHLPLAQISSAVGFSSQSHLTTCYQKFYNTTPARHRRSHQVSRTDVEA